MKNIRFIEVRSEIGAGTRGSSLGLDAIKIAALNEGSHLFNDIHSVEIPNENYLLYEDEGSPYAKRIEGIYRLYKNVMPTIASTLLSGHFPIVLGGDHSIAGGTIAGIKKAFPDSRLGIIWIDAHADLHSPYTTPSGNLHGMAISAALGEDNKEDQLNKLDENTIEYWEKLKNIGGICPKIHYKDLVYIALRDTEHEEHFLLKKNQVKIITTSKAKKIGIESVVAESFQHLDECDLIYVSFDVDCMDASIIQGTGTPVRHGLNQLEAGGILELLVQNKKVCCLEFSEVNPTFDSQNTTAKITFSIVQKALNKLNNK
jgi:arginase